MGPLEQGGNHDPLLLPKDFVELLTETSVCNFKSELLFETRLGKQLGDLVPNTGLLGDTQFRNLFP